MTPLSTEDRALMVRCPQRDVVQASLKGMPSDVQRRLAQVVRLRAAGLIRVELDVDCSDARYITRTIDLTDAGIQALRGPAK